jgi:hypothetical protein
MVFRYPALATQLASTSSASRSPTDRRRRCGGAFASMAPAAVAPGYLLKGAGLQKLPDAN